MKHDLAWTEDPITLAELTRELLAGCKELDVALSEADAAWLVEYLARLVRKNAEVNLTRIVGPDSGVRLHLLDSLGAALDVQDAPAGVIVDVGSGGGFPGVPLAVQSRRETWLLDSVMKKTAAVDQLLRELGRSGHIRATSARAEELAKEHAGSFAVVVARAVAPLPALVELASPLLARGGRLIALKARPTDSELASGVAASRLVGMEFVRSRAFTLPESDEQRVVLTYEKVRAPRVALPRRSGLAQHTPLA